MELVVGRCVRVAPGVLQVGLGFIELELGRCFRAASRPGLS